MDIKLEDNQATILVDVWMPAVRDRLRNKSVNRTVALPARLDRLAMGAKINFSHTQQESLENRLDAR
ncbi:MAG: hypothetical protein SOR75_01255 [Synergistes jonesii]|uniref:hypothetical protein n=1 Tax=Synergistes jonesii TaxID=2754 RepID=UPI002A74D3CB|nr:hypothetical protein [Synergistes jonesii]MDY2983938.1 hypothetical protein [Synergistes jonesii]